MSYFKSVNDLAIFLNLDFKKLNYIAYKIPIEEKYDRFVIKKRSGADREILSPTQPLKTYQVKIKSVLDLFYKPSPICHSYVQSRSILTNAKIHKGSRWFLKIDLKDFFPSIHFGRIRGALESQPYAFDSTTARYIAHLCTHNRTLPQGAPTSPTISNIVCRSLDNSLFNIARKFDCRVSRYADDIIFSCNHKIFPEGIAKKELNKTKLSEELLEIFNLNNFIINESKTRLYGIHEKHLATGIVVNKKLNVTTDFYRTLRSLVHNFCTMSKEETTRRFLEKKDKKNRPRATIFDIENIITGKIFFLQSVVGHHDLRYKRIANRFSQKSKRFKLNLNKSYQKSQREILLFCEGKTDPIIVKKILDFWHERDKHTDINILFDKSVGLDGDTNLYDKLQKNIGSSTSKLTIFLFDADNPKILNSLKHHKDSWWKKWSDGVYSLIIPRPEHLPAVLTRYPIELVNTIQDLQSFYVGDKRLFLFNEFNQEDQTHLNDQRIKTYKIINDKNKDSHPIIYDQDVIKLIDDGFGELFKYSLALSKNNFAINYDLSNMSADSMKATHLLLNEIRSILRDYLK
jgi:RNA-directed DNA polymerase